MSERARVGADFQAEADAHDVHYSGGSRRYATLDEFRREFELIQMSPFHRGGSTKGHVRGMAVRSLIEAAGTAGLAPAQCRVIDAACGMGHLSIYLASCGFQVTGVDLSNVAIESARELAGQLGVQDRAQFRCVSLSDTQLPADTVDFIIGHGALHHFIKYDGIPAEFFRVLKPGGQGFFADSFAENPLYALFHDKAMMERLGDVKLNRRLIGRYFDEFEVRLVPADWFVMLDKLFTRVGGKRMEGFARRLSALWYRLDRLIPPTSPTALAWSGAVMTAIRAPGRPAGEDPFLFRGVSLRH